MREAIVSLATMSPNNAEDVYRVCILEIGNKSLVKVDK